ncbi:MAG: aspartyl protease family protein [Phycisphaerales bacterium]
MARETIPFSPRTGLPVVAVVIGWSQAERDEFKRIGLALPDATDAAPTDALVDTGAHRSFIPEDYVERLGLAPIGEGIVQQSLGGAIVVPFYAARIEIITRSGLTWQRHGLAPTIQVGVIPSNHGAARVLPMPIVGRDVLATCVFRYDGPARTLEFDSAPKRPRRKPKA